MRSLFHFHLLRRHIHTKSWHVRTTPGSTLRMQLPLSANVRLRALDPLTSDWHEAKVDLRVLSDENGSKTEESTKNVFDRLQPVIEPEGDVVHVKTNPAEAHVELDVLIPGKFDLDAKLGDGNLSMEDTLEGDVRIHSAAANVSLQKTKGMNVDVYSGKGDISASVLQGNVKLQTSGGKICVGRVQGPDVRMESVDGGIEIGAVYANSIEISSQRGTVQVQGVQGDARIRTGEKAKLSGVEGNLDVEGRDVEVRLSVPKRVQIRSEGNVNVGLAEGVGGEVVVDGKVTWEGIEDGKLGEGEARIEVKAKGEINIKRTGWAEGFGFLAGSRMAAEKG